MTRLATLLSASLLLLSPAPAFSTTVDLIDGQGTLTWDTSVGVSALSQNTAVTHPSFPANRHGHEGWFLYVNLGPGFLHEFTNFTKTTNGANQDVLTSSYTTLFNETFQLDLTYGINAVGPDGLPDLSWSGSLFRPAAGATLPVINIRLFNVFDYDIGVAPSLDSATVTQTTGPNSTLIDIMGTGSLPGKRGAFNNARYSVNTLADIVSQIQVNNILDDTAAPGAYDVAGAFEWDINMEIGTGSGGGGGGGSLGGFGGFGAFDDVPEPSTGVLLMVGFLYLARQSGARSSSQPPEA